MPVHKNMKLYLTSVAANVLPNVVSAIGGDVRGLKVAFIPTAGNPYKETSWITEDRKALLSCNFEVVDIDISNKTEREIQNVVESVDIIFAAGGNTFYLLEKVKKSGFDKIIKDFVSQNKIYIGSSAGSIIIGPDIEFADVFDDPTVANLDSTEGIALIDFIPVPHYKKGSFKYEEVLKKYKEKYTLIPLNDNQFIIVEDNGYRVVGKEE